MFGRKYDVVTIGAATIDAFVWSKAFHEIKSLKFTTGVGECFSLGSKIDIDHFVLSTGGGATNAAATFANLHMKTACVSSVGDDLFGRGVKEDFAKRHISTALLSEVRGEQTAFSTILVMPDGERTVLTARGVSERLSPEKIHWSRIAAKWIYMTSLGGNLPLLRHVLQHAARHRINVFWNPGAKDLAHGMKKLVPLFRQGVSLLDMNSEEAASFTNRSIKDVVGMLRDLRATGVPRVLLTDGEKGATVASEDGRWFIPANKKIHAINRTGAGDAFGSGFLAGLIKYDDEEMALKCGLLNAQGVIQKIGAKTGLRTTWPTQKELGKIVVKKIVKKYA